MNLLVLLAQTAAACYMVGFIWTMQILHYPLFDRVGRDAFAAYETEHNQRFGVLLGPGIVLVAVTANLLIGRAALIIGGSMLKWNPLTGSYASRPGLSLACPW